MKKGKNENMDQFSFVEEPGFVPRLRLRAMALKAVDQEVTEANRHKGASEIDPDFANDLGLDQTNNENSYELHMERAGYHLVRACGECAIRACDKRKKILSWEPEYHYANKRHAQIKKAVGEAEKGIETPC
jgi:hypothetical protein